MGYKLNLIREVIRDIYNNSFYDYINLNSTYIGFRMNLLIFLILILLGSIIILLKNKKKPLKDYLYSLIYIFIIIVYLVFVGNIFFKINDNIIDQNTMRLYKDISLLIIIPLIYFIVKFILIVIGFNLKKFNFTQDIIDLKEEAKDNEEIELIFDKNTYKYKRTLRRIYREFKYYILENKVFISIIVGVLSIILFVSLFSVNIFNKNKVKIGESFNAAGFNYIVNDVYETLYDVNLNLIKDDGKFIIASVNVKNLNEETINIDFKKIRLLYGEDYVYANNYFNKFFYDLGIPYNNENLKKGETKEFIFIFKVPRSYKSNKYILKFYDKVSVQDEEKYGSYKEIKVRATKSDKKINEKNVNLKENVIFNKNKFGNSNITIFNSDIRSSYVFNDEGKNKVIRDNDINRILLVLEYKLEIDLDSKLSMYYNKDIDFFDNFVTITYNLNGKEKNYNNVNVIGNVDGKVMLSVPYEVKSANSLNLNINFRDVKIIYKLK